MTLSQLFPCLHYLVSRLASLETKCRMMQTLLALNTLFLRAGYFWVCRSTKLKFLELYVLPMNTFRHSNCEVVPGSCLL